MDRITVTCWAGVGLQGWAWIGSELQVGQVYDCRVGHG